MKIVLNVKMENVLNVLYLTNFWLMPMVTELVNVKKDMPIYKKKDVLTKPPLDTILTKLPEQLKLV